VVGIKLLKNVPSGKEFILNDGRSIKNLYELTNALNSMSDDTFFCHVNKNKNDFSNWIFYVFKDEDLAKKLSGLKKRSAILKTLNKKLSGLNKVKKIKPVIKKENVKVAVSKPIVHQLEKIKKENVKASKSEKKYSKDILEKVDEILLRELQILKKEEKIEKIEQDLEEKLKLIKKSNSHSHEFFSKEFVQGIAAGFLLTVIIALVYVRFIAA